MSSPLFTPEPWRDGPPRIGARAVVYFRVVGEPRLLIGRRTLSGISCGCRYGHSPHCPSPANLHLEARRVLFHAPEDLDAWRRIDPHFARPDGNAPFALRWRTPSALPGFENHAAAIVRVSSGFGGPPKVQRAFFGDEPLEYTLPAFWLPLPEALS